MQQLRCNWCILVAISCPCHFPMQILATIEMSPWHFIHLLMDETCSYLLNLLTTILQLNFDKKFQYFSFMH
jgi:hypothetical protein